MKVMLQLNALVGLASTMAASAMIALVLTRPAEVASAVAAREYGTVGPRDGERAHGMAARHPQVPLEMDRVMDMDQPPSRLLRPGAIAAGAILLTVGVAMLLDSSGAAHVTLGRLIGPLMLIALGSSILLEKGIAIASAAGIEDGTGVERVGRRKRAATRATACG